MHLVPTAFAVSSLAFAVILATTGETLALGIAAANALAAMVSSYAALRIARQRKGNEAE